MSSPASELSPRKLMLTLWAAGAVGTFLVAAVVWGQTPPAADGEKPIVRPLQSAVPSGTVSSARETLGPSPVVPLAEQPAAKIVVDPPLPDQLANGLVVLQYRTENFRVMPVFGTAAIAVSPRIGHIHMTVDDNPWVWGVWHGTNGGELILGGLPPGPHKVLIELENPNHQPIAQDVVKFEVPQRSPTRPNPKAGESSPDPVVVSPAKQPPAEIIIDPPQPDSLARGLVLIQYRTENLQLVPVYGPAALGISPRIGHVRVTVDDAPWHWADATGQPVVVNGLPPGPHKILIELVDAIGKPLTQGIVKFDVPRR